MTTSGEPWPGHEPAWQEWQSAMASARMHHAWILAGVQGIGKGHFARAAAAALVAEPGVPQPSFAAHPDILLPEHPPENKEEAKKRDDGQDYRRKRSIPVDEIRALQRRLNTRPTLGQHRAVVIDPADDLEKSAINALLKSLEEPPAGTFFLLVVHRLGSLLPTIRSRCRLLRFPALADDQVERILVREAPEADAPTRAAAIAAAQGSPGVALDFVHQDLAPVHALMRRILAEGDGQLVLRGALAEAVGARPTRERQLAVIDLARAELSFGLGTADPAVQSRRIEAHAALVRLAAQVPAYNFDPGLLALEIGGLLATTAPRRG
jgi:DNA polymerase-3 subunit delta'